MKGPDNIDGLLSGLKQKASENIVIDRNDDDNLSTVSITELEDMKKNDKNTMLEKRRRNMIKILYQFRYLIHKK